MTITDMSIPMLRHPDVNVYIDAGANIGGYISMHAPLVREIHAFEPFPGVQEQLKSVAKKTEERTGTRVVVNSVGLSDVSCEMHNVRVFEAWTLSNENLGHGLHEEYQPFSMQLTTLDQYVEEAKLTSVDFMKVDVDGYELRLLRGALGTIMTWKPSILIELSCYVEKLGDNREELVRMILDMGYRVFFSVGTGTSKDLEIHGFDAIMALGHWRSSGDVALIHSDKAKLLGIP